MGAFQILNTPTARRGTGTCHEPWQNRPTNGGSRRTATIPKWFLSGLRSTRKARLMNSSGAEEDGLVGGFLKAHGSVLGSIDLTTVEVGPKAGLTTMALSTVLSQERLDRPLLVDLQSHIESTVMVDRISIGIQYRRVPVPKRLVPELIVTGQSDVSPGDVKPRVGSGQHHKWPLRPLAMMRFPIVRQIEKHRIIEHGPRPFRHTLQTADNPIDQRHVLVTHLISDIECFHTAK